MPKVSLSIPTNLEDENCLTLQMQTDFTLERNSQSQHHLVVQDKLNQDKVLEEVVISDKTLDQLSQTCVNFNQLQLFMRTFIEGKMAQDILKVNAGIKKAKFLKDFIVSPLDLQIISTQTTYENHDHQIHKRHLVSLRQNSLQEVEEEFRRREQVKQALKGSNAEKIVMSDTKIDIKNHFNLQLRIKQMKNYFQLIQLILYQQGLIVAVSAKPYIDDFTSEETNQRQNLNQNMLIFKDAALYKKPSGRSVRSKLLHQEHEPIQDPRNSEPDDSEDIVNLSVYQKKSVEPSEEMLSLEELVLQNRNKEYQNQNLNDRTSRSTTIGLAKRKSFVIVYSKLLVDTAGLAVSLLDDITSQYEESLLQICFSNLDLSQTNLSEQETNRTLAQRSKIQEQVIRIFLKSGLLPQDQNLGRLFSQKIQITLSASYFNHKSFGEEMLLEENSLEICAQQLNYTQALLNQISSCSFFNINVSYGCMLSVYKVVSALIEEEIVLSRLQTAQNPYGAGNLHINQSEEKSSVTKSLSKVQESDEDDSIVEQELLSQKDLSRSRSFKAEDINQDGNLAQDEYDEAKRRAQLMPIFKFSNLTGRKVQFKIQNEDHQQVMSQIEEADSGFVFILPAGQSFLDDSSLECRKIRRAVENLLHTFSTDELKDVQLYIDFQVEGYQTIQDVSLNQFGLFGFCLKPDNKKGKQTAYTLVRLIRNRGETVVYFETNCVVHNSTQTPIKLIPFENETVLDKEVQIYLKPNSVQVIPLEWFEMNVQVQVVDANVDTNFLKQNKSQSLFANGGINQVLNPTITNPYYNHAQKINLNEQWFSLELALLATRTEIAQFLILIQPLTSFHNLTFFPIEIKACQDGKIKTDTPSYCLKPNESAFIKELDLLTTRRSNQCFSLQIDINNQPENKLSALIDQTKIKSMSKNKILNVQKCIIIELFPNNQQNQAQKSAKQISSKPEQKICVVMEKVACLDGIFDTEYNNFSLRKRIFHHSSSERYEFYSPFVVVNQTLHDINLLNFDNQQVGSVKSYDNLLLNFKLFSKAKLRIKVKNHETSEKMDMLTAGVHGTLALKQEQNRTTKNQHDSGKLIEIGTSIKFCQYPFTKTRVIRFTKRFQFINTLRYPIVIQEPNYRKTQFVIGVGKSMAVDFHEENVNRLLQVRMSTKSETEKLGSEDSIELNEFRYFVQQTQWSIEFCGSYVDDFQVSLPRLDSLSDKEPRKRGWANQFEDKKIVRISITTDNEFTEKLYCVIGRPLYPDFLFLNYSSNSLLVQQKLSKQEIREQHQPNQIFQIGQGNKSESLADIPAALPLILNPLKQNKKKKLEITINMDNGHQTKIQYIIDEPEFEFTVKSGQGRSARQKLLRIRTRVAGNMRIIELFKVTKFEKLKVAQSIAFDKMTDENINLKIKELEDIYNTNFETNDPSEDFSSYKLTNTKLEINLAGIGLSLIDFTPVELCYISIDNIKFVQQICQVEMGQLFQKSVTKIDLKINNFQIDAMQNKVFPVLLGPKKPFRNIERLYRKEKGIQDLEDEIVPIVQFSYEGTNQNDGNITTSTIENLIFAVQELEFKLHLSFVLEIQALLMSLITLINDLDKLQGSAFKKELIETQLMMNGRSKKISWQDSRQFNKNESQTLNGFSSTIKEYNTSQNTKLKMQQDLLDDQSCDQILDQGRVKQKEELCSDIKPSVERSVEFKHPKVNKIFVNSLKISAIKFFVTLRIRGIEQTMRKGGPMGFILNLGSNFADISDAEFSFTDLEMVKQQMSDIRLTENLINHFKGEAIQQFYQILGSQDIIGNPSNFLTNITQGAEDLQNQPLQGLVQHDARLAIQGISRGVVGLLKNTTVAVSSSYSGISGSLYLGLRNLSGAGLTHSNLDQPLTFGGGLLKGGAGFFHELKGGLLSIYKVPQQKVREQGFGAPQLAKGIFQGVLQTTLSPINSPLRFSYNLSTGIKNQAKGVKDHGQRYRYPRFFDQTERMPPYDHQLSHAQHALTIVKNGKYRNEVVEHVFDTSIYTQENFQGFFKDRVMIITNKSMFFIEINNNKLLNFCSLGAVNGMMFYFQDKRSNSIVLESTRGIVRFETGLPDLNQQILAVLKIKLEQISNLHAAAKFKEVKSGKGLLSIIPPEIRKQNDRAIYEQPQMLENVFHVSQISGKQEDGVPNIESKPITEQSDEDESGESYLTWETIREEDQN